MTKAKAEAPYELPTVRRSKCAVCGIIVETDIPPLNACSEHKAGVAKANKAKGETLRAGKREGS